MGPPLKERPASYSGNTGAAGSAPQTARGVKPGAV